MKLNSLMILIDITIVKIRFVGFLLSFFRLYVNFFPGILKIL